MALIFEKYSSLKLFNIVWFLNVFLSFMSYKSAESSLGIFGKTKGLAKIIQLSSDS